MMPFLICWKHRESKSMQKSGMHDIVERIKDDLKKNGIGCAAVLACLILFALIFHDVCPVQILYGLPCPGCGLTRAGVLLLTGHFAAAFQMHPFIYGWAALLLYVLLCRYIKGCKPKGALQLMIVLIACMLLFYIYRMLLYFPDVEPMTCKDGLLLHWNPDRN